MNFITGNKFTYAITIASAQHTCFSMRQCTLLNKLTFLCHFYFTNPVWVYKHVWEVLLKHSPLHKRKAQLLAETKFLVRVVELGIVLQ